MNTAYRMPAFFVRLCVFSTHPYFEKTNLFKFFKIEGGTVLPLMACKVSLQSLLATLIAISVANNGNDSAQVAGRCIAYVRPATRIPSALLHVVPMPAWEQRKFGELYRPVSEKNDVSFGRDKAISVANMYFNPAVYVTEDSYLATYNVMRLGDIAFEGNRSKRFAHGRFVENTIGDGIVSHVFKVFRHVGDNYDLSYWKHAINNEKLMKDVLTRSTKASTMMHELVTADFLEELTLVPSLNEQRAIGAAIDSIDNLITLHQRKYDKLVVFKKSMLEKMFPKDGESVPEIRFAGFTDPWEQRKFGELYRPVSEKNDVSFGRDKAISVANMYFNPAVYVTEDSYLATYNVMRLGDIAFEGNRSKRFAHGRFVENTIGDGIVSHVFKVFRHVGDNYDLSYWKHAINNEKLMKDVLTRSTKASTMMHELVTADFLEELTLVPSLNEQRAIGAAIDSIDNLITLHQRKRLWFAK